LKNGFPGGRWRPAANRLLPVRLGCGFWHNLPMRFLTAFRDFLQTWQGTAVTVLAILSALYYGPRKLLETWDWYCDRYRDSEVFIVIAHPKILDAPAVRSNFPNVKIGLSKRTEFAYTVPEIAGFLGRKEGSVEASLKRLRRRGKIEPYQDGWRLKG
jgi:hypothetical protein